MILYPSAETRTHFKNPPWTTLVVCLVLGALFISVYAPRRAQYQEKKRLVRQLLVQALDEEVSEGRLRHDLALRAQEDPAYLNADPELKQALSLTTLKKLEAWTQTQNPQDSMVGDNLGEKVFFSLVPNNAALLITIILGLILFGYMLEHIYSSFVVGLVYLLSIVGIQYLDWVLPTDYQPHPALNWANWSLAIVTMTFLMAPLGAITLTLKTWIGRITNIEIKVPTAVLYLVFIASFLIINFKFSSQDEYSLKSLAGSLVISFSLLLLLWKAPTRSKIIQNQGRTSDSELASIELLFKEDHDEKALAKIEELLRNDLSSDQLLRVADMAWQHNASEMANRTYNLGFRNMITENQNLTEILPIFEKLVVRGVPFPLSIMRSTLEKALANNHVSLVRRLLPYYQKQEQVSREALLDIYEKLHAKLATPGKEDETGLQELLSWSEEDPVFSPLHHKIMMYFSSKAEGQTGFLESYSALNRIDHHVDIQIKGIETTHVSVVLPNGQAQNVPWSAAMGLMGGHVLTPERGYRGCFFLKNKRKIFACHFRPKDVDLTRNGAAITFEDFYVWFRQEAPEDIPVIEFDQFKDFNDESAYMDEVEKFLVQTQPIIDGGRIL
ncbi:MAG: hypothetical protein H6510_00085 [Acidobacteria bacterium]|nr:hypothetical protein [Acidobacteriota bacterium]